MSSGSDVTPVTLTHGKRVMVGRDPHEAMRVATPLELLFDLVFVIAFGVAGNEAAHLAALGAWDAAAGGFAFAMFAVMWAWINFTWFASAFDTDDWPYRLAVMVQMIGVVILALGIPAMFVSLHHHEPVDNIAIVTGYVIMRVPLISLWARVARQDPANAPNAGIYIATLTIAQIGWCVLMLIDTTATVFFIAAAPLFIIELGGPFLAEHRHGGTPWHAHHIAERYGLLAIISFGEILIGTVAALQSVLDTQGWSFEIARLAVFGVALTFGLWWTYFNLPTGEALHLARHRSFWFGYGHMVLYAAIAAVGAGLHVGALFIDNHAEISETAVIASIAIPAAVVMVSIAAVHAILLGWFTRANVLVAIKVCICALSVILVAVGVDVVWGIGTLVLAPTVSVIAHEADLGRPRPSP